MPHILQLIFMNISAQYILLSYSISMFTNLDLIFLKHAQTQHQRQFTKIGQNQQSNTQIQAIKQMGLIRDQKITEFGREQCKQIAETLNWNSISLIIVSPMRSCLDTCKFLLQLSKKNIQVEVEPLISAKIQNPWSMGSPKAALQRQYPEFSFKNLNDCEHLPWYLQNLCILKQKKLVQLGQKKLNAKIIQDYFEFRSRMLNFQRVLKNRMGKLREGERVLIISHNQVFKMITAKCFNQLGKCMSDINLNSAQINYASSQRIFQPLSPAPAL